ncbi:MAG: curli production assembly protein CsgG [Chlorobiaceae bacterium]|jgi:curli biogenesis system outer membrane secretion channel CsgG|nr:curli production assembly protein CsgG [Chlorobiaceae bacterium]
MNKHFFSALKPALPMIAVSLLFGCATTETHQALVVEKVNSATVSYSGVKSSLVVGKFDNRSSFMRGLFSDGNDRLGSQAKTILLSHLQQSNHFNVMDRDNMNEAKQEATLGGKTQNIRSAGYLVTGDITDFGRKESGDQQLFGVLGRGKSQVAYAKVTLNLVDTLTSEIVCSVQGAGEYSLSNREVIGFGGTAEYDSTLNGKVLDLAIREAVNRLVEGMDNGAWKLKN